MILYHYTSGRHLRAIARHGLTVGDVPTDIRREAGRVGVWLTNAVTAGGHGLERSAADKTAYRLSVEVPDGSPLLHKWTEWASAHATEETINALHSTAARYEGEGPETWYVYFGVLPATSIKVCFDTKAGVEIENWSEISPPELDIPGVPAWRRETWHRQLLKKVRRALQAGRQGQIRHP